MKMNYTPPTMYLSIIILIIGVWTSDAYQQRSLQTKMKMSSSSHDNTRRSTILAFPAFAMIAGTFTASSPCLALDMDSFMAKELTSAKVPPKMSDDEALCKFGAPSKGTGNACLRAGLPTKRRTGVDAFGTVDRECSDFHEELH